MKRHARTAWRWHQFLQQHPKVAYVDYCGLPTSPLPCPGCRNICPTASCGVVSFGLAGGREAASTFMRELKLAAIETHVADARTCCLNPPPPPTAR